MHTARKFAISAFGEAGVSASDHPLPTSGEKMIRKPTTSNLLCTLPQNDGFPTHPCPPAPWESNNNPSSALQAKENKEDNIPETLEEYKNRGNWVRIKIKKIIHGASKSEITGGKPQVPSGEPGDAHLGWIFWAWKLCGNYAGLQDYAGLCGPKKLPPVYCSNSIETKIILIWIDLICLRSLSGPFLSCISPPQKAKYAGLFGQVF